MKTKITFQKCGRGDRAAGHTAILPIEPDDYDAIEVGVAREAKQFLASSGVDAGVDEANGTFMVSAGDRVVGSGTFEAVS